MSKNSYLILQDIQLIFINHILCSRQRQSQSELLQFHPESEPGILGAVFDLASQCFDYSLVLLVGDGFGLGVVTVVAQHPVLISLILQLILFPLGVLLRLLHFYGIAMDSRILIIIHFLTKVPT